MREDMRLEEIRDNEMNSQDERRKRRVKKKRERERTGDRRWRDAIREDTRR